MCLAGLGELGMDPHTDSGAPIGSPSAIAVPLLTWYAIAAFPSAVMKCALSGQVAIQERLPPP